MCILPREALIQPYSGDASRTSLEVYSRLALAQTQAQQIYERAVVDFPV